MMLAALTVLVLSGSPSRIIVCGPPLTQKPKLRILPRTTPEFSPLAHAPAAFEEPRDRPRSYASLDGSPALQNDGPPERAVRFRRYERKPFTERRHFIKRRLPF